VNLLEFARGPALRVAFIIMAAGLSWRLIRLVLLRRTPQFATPRPGSPSRAVGALHTIFHRFWPAKPFRDRANLPTILAYVFHVGILLILLTGTPHILFFGDILGFTWPGLPKGIIDIISALTLGALVAMLIRRLTHPVLRLLSETDDYFTWFVTTLPVLTGLLATSELGGRYENLLAVHILSVALLMAWFPFGKLMHAFLFVLSRGTTGARYSRRGAKT
jgi:nitrate reductase gamma subunit